MRQRTSRTPPLPGPLLHSEMEEREPACRVSGFARFPPRRGIALLLGRSFGCEQGIIKYCSMAVCLGQTAMGGQQSIIMRGHSLWVLGLAACGLFPGALQAGAPPSDPIFSDDFESGTLNQWTVTAGSPLDPFAGLNAVPPAGNYTAYMNNSADQMHRNLITDNGGQEVAGPLVASWWIYDPVAAPAAARAFNEIRAYAGGSGLPNGGAVASGTLSQSLAAGKYDTVTMVGEGFNINKYQGRVAFGTITGWFNLGGPGSPNRSPGWHKFEVEVAADPSVIRFYVDGILSRTITGAAVDTYDTLVMGPGTGTTAGDAWFDEVRVGQVKPDLMKIERLPDGRLRISWLGFGRLEFTTMLSNPSSATQWTTAETGTANPAILSPTGPQRFFRVVRNTTP